MNQASNILIKERVAVYVDGFNLYFGMLESGIKGKWLDITSLAVSLLKPNQELVSIKYFTSRVSNDPAKQKRQSTYLEALESSDVQIFYGHYQSGTTVCNRCGHVWMTFNEKMTDVNIATQMLLDASADKYDMAMLISADSDLVPPVKYIHQLYTTKRVFVAFPPSRHSKQLQAIAKGSLTLGRKTIMNNQFTAEVTKKDGFKLIKPQVWE